MFLAYNNLYDGKIYSYENNLKTSKLKTFDLKEDLAKKDKLREEI